MIKKIDNLVCVINWSNKQYSINEHNFISVLYRCGTELKVFDFSLSYTVQNRNLKIIDFKLLLKSRYDYLRIKGTINTAKPTISTKRISIRYPIAYDRTELDSSPLCYQVFSRLSEPLYINLLSKQETLWLVDK